MLQGEPLSAEALRPGTLRVGACVLTALTLACGDAPGPGAGSDPTPTAERLHAPGELRLTSAGKPPRLPLRYRLAPGQHQTYRTWVTLEHRAIGATARLATEFDWERTVLSSSAGVAQIQMKVGRVRTVSPESLRDAVAPRLSALLLTATLDPRGRASAVTPREALPAHGGDALFARFTAPLPEDAVGEGATWERVEPWSLTLPRVEQRLDIGVRTRYRLSFTLARGEPKQARIAADLRFHLVRPASTKAGRMGVTGAGQGSAEWVLDLLRGEPTSSHSELDLNLQVISNGRTQRLHQRLGSRTSKVRSTPPRRATPKPRGAHGASR